MIADSRETSYAGRSASSPAADLSIWRGSGDFTQLPGSLHAKQQNEEDKYIHVRSVEENPHRRKVCEPFYLTLCGDSCAIPARATPQSLSLQVGLEDDKSFAEPWAFADLNKVGRQERTKNLPLWGAWSE